MAKDSVSTWLTVFSVASIVFGILGIIITTVAILALLVLTEFMIPAPRSDILVAVVGLFGLAFSLIYIFAGIGVQKRASYGRTLGIVASFLSLLSFPLGTAYGVLGIWLLLMENSSIKQFSK